MDWEIEFYRKVGEELAGSSLRFVKKDQKIPKKDLELAKERLKEVKKS